MFSSDKNIEILARLITNLRHYGELRLKRLQLDFVGKMTLVLSALIVGGVVFCVAGFIVLFLSLAATYALAPYVGGYVMALIIMALIHLLVAVIAFSMRRKLIIDPIANLLASLFLDDEPEEESTP